jgi:hypothetical protein
MKRKYVFTGDEKIIDSVIILRRIRRCADGLLGGWIESESNLSQEGACFVFNEACVLDQAVVKDNAQIMGDSVVCDLAVVGGDIKIVHCLIGGTAFITASEGVLVGAKIDTDDDLCREAA